MGRGSFSADKEVPLALLDTDVPSCQKTGMAQARQIIPLENVERRIYAIRDHNVMLDFDLAELYGVTTSRLNEKVKRAIS